MVTKAVSLSMRIWSGVKKVPRRESHGVGQQKGRVPHKFWSILAQFKKILGAKLSGSFNRKFTLSYHLSTEVYGYHVTSRPSSPTDVTSKSCHLGQSKCHLDNCPKFSSEWKWNSAYQFLTLARWVFKQLKFFSSNILPLYRISSVPNSIWSRTSGAQRTWLVLIRFDFHDHIHVYIASFEFCYSLGKLVAKGIVIVRD